LSEIRIQIDENGKLSIKNECKAGEEEQSLQEIRELMEGLADVDEIIHLPPREDEPNRYEGMGTKLKKNKGIDDKAHIRRE
jgi:hypothetical protein